MYARFFAATAAFSTLVSGNPAITAQHDAAFVLKRQMNSNSTCQVFGIDFQNGGSYFINSASNANFTIVSQFEGCNNDTATIMLVNDQTSDEYECTSVPTVPNDVSQTSTCPIEKSQLVSGNYSILTLGNNGNGNPFAYERDFVLTVGLQQTVTVTATADCTYTSYPATTTTRELSDTGVK